VPKNQHFTNLINFINLINLTNFINLTPPPHAPKNGPLLAGGPGRTGLQANCAPVCFDFIRNGFIDFQQRPDGVQPFGFLFPWQVARCRCRAMFCAGFAQMLHRFFSQMLRRNL
jgi:hypothetical protein